MKGNAAWGPRWTAGCQMDSATQYAIGLLAMAEGPPIAIGSDTSWKGEFLRTHGGGEYKPQKETPKDTKQKGLGEHWLIASE